MSSFSESLTVTLTADSSALQSELQNVVSQLDTLKSRVQSVQQGFQQAGSAANGLGAAVGPVQNLGRALQQVAGQVDALSHMSISLNVTPALNALNMLSQAIAQVAAQFQSLAVPMAPGIPFGGPLPGPRSPVEGYARGGLVGGLPGIDRVPAWLSAGEFVLRPAAVEQLGVAFLQALNDRPQGFRRGDLPQSGGADSASVTNHFGGITVQVQTATDVSHVLDALAQEQSRLATRRG
ncbi:hypothetical protein [Planctellipticum variicoloris]|uniref:hypothetical protein n=1 Tax=Planctellipticum variicoloris TaxID=3064265 RepID=UPI0030133440|nr:hypothetical protein SH412_004690 [Planctomycetaceae bacterium SH412]